MIEERAVPSVIDPVGGVTVNPAKAAASHEYRGETYYFCSKGCAEKFRADPDRYLKTTPGPAVVTTTPSAPVITLTRAAATPRAGASATPRDQVEYTCPM